MNANTVEFYCHSQAKIPIGYIQQGKVCGHLLATIDERCAIDIEVNCPVCGSMNHLVHHKGVTALKKFREGSECGDA